MAGYLDHYGAGEERRENIVKKALIALGVLLVIVGGVLLYIFHNFRQEHQRQPVLLAAGGARLQRRICAVGLH